MQYIPTVSLPILLLHVVCMYSGTPKICSFHNFVWELQVGFVGF